MKTSHALLALLALAVAPSVASAQQQQVGENYELIGGQSDDDDARWIYTWWDDRGIFHGVDSLDLVPRAFQDRAQRTRAVEAIQLGVRLKTDDRSASGSRQRLRPNLPPTDRGTQAQSDAPERDQTRKTQSDLARERSERLALLRTQLRAVEEQLAALEEGTVPTESPDDQALTDAQLDARLTHLETRFEYLTSEIDALSKGS